MKKGIIAAFLIIALMAFTIYFIVGCSNGTSIPSVDMPDMPDGDLDGSTDVSGTWTGTWGSYQAGGNSGSISSLELEQSDSGDGSYSLSGTLTMDGYSPLEGQTGTISGTNNTGTVKFTATFDNGSTIEFSGNATSISMSGTYTITENQTESDNGNFTLTKQ